MSQNQILDQHTDCDGIKTLNNSLFEIITLLLQSSLVFTHSEQLGFSFLQPACELINHLAGKGRERENINVNAMRVLMTDLFTCA